MKWEENNSMGNASNANNVRLETSRQISNKMREYFQCKVNNLETDTKNKNIKALRRFKKCCQYSTD